MRDGANQIAARALLPARRRDEPRLYAGFGENALTVTSVIPGCIRRAFRHPNLVANVIQTFHG